MGIAQRLAVAGLVGGLAITGLGVAAAQTDPAAPPSTTEKAPEAEADEVKPAPGPGGKFHVRGKGRPFPGRGPAFGFGPGFGAIHGEFTTRQPDGTFRTVATQNGEATEVSQDEITIKSEDGYSKTYVVDEDTFVGAGRDGIGDVKVGDEVHVMAVIEDGTAKARRLTDATNLRRFAEKWGHKKGGR